MEHDAGDDCHQGLCYAGDCLDQNAGDNGRRLLHSAGFNHISKHVIMNWTQHCVCNLSTPALAICCMHHHVACIMLVYSLPHLLHLVNTARAPCTSPAYLASRNMHTCIIYNTLHIYITLHACISRNMLHVLYIMPCTPTSCATLAASCVDTAQHAASPARHAQEQILQHLARLHLATCCMHCIQCLAHLYHHVQHLALHAASCNTRCILR
ncbi:hypothetical protein ACQKWADRAFT_275466 [Trichoderma austrokoningii]